MEKRVKSMIDHNFNIIEKNITEEVEAKLNDFIQKSNMNFDSGLIYKLRCSIEEECWEFLYSRIEHKIIVEELYAEKSKEEALNRLPKWIVEL